MALQIRKLTNEIYEIEDGSITLSVKEAIANYKRVQNIKYTINDLLLFLFYSQSDKNIVGRTVLFKELFLMEREIFSAYLFDWKNVPGQEEWKLIKFISRFTHEGLGHPSIKKTNKNTIRIDYGTHSLSLRLSTYNTRAVLSYDDKERLPLYIFLANQFRKNIDIYYKTIETEDCGFIPHFYGPYSFSVANRLENMISVGLINRKGKRSTNSEEFSITGKGKQLIKRKYEELSDIVKHKLRERRKGLDQYGTKWILNHVYNFYPEFTSKSKVRYKYDLITWGRIGKKDVVY
jgi:uncharacterized protein YwgA